MNSLAARIDSFTPTSPPKSTRSRRAATPKLSWPHPHSFLANPRSLAEAGFYFQPSVENPDNVICFMCDKELSEWEPDDDPHRVHVEKRPTCSWAMVKCDLLLQKKHSSTSSSSPSSPAMDKARLETFGRKSQRWWPHDQIKSHGALSKHMAKAGFVYTPTTDPEDDTATCFHCGLALSGWEINDDPLKEHSRREVASSCPFILSMDSAKTSHKEHIPSQTTRHVTTEPNVVSAPQPKSSKGKRRRKKTAAVGVETHDEPDPDPEKGSNIELEPEPRRATRHQSKSRTNQRVKEKGSDVVDSVQKIVKGKKRQNKAGLSQLPIDETMEGSGQDPETRRTTRQQSKPRSTATEKENIPAHVDNEVETSRSDTTKENTQPKGKKKKKKKPEKDPVVNNENSRDIVSPEVSREVPTDPSNQEISTETPEPNLLAFAPVEGGGGEGLEVFSGEVVRDFQELFPGLNLPRPLMEGRRVEVPVLDAEERAMTVEEWIRAEMERQLEDLLSDGERALKQFTLHAEKVRERISAL